MAAVDGGARGVLVTTPGPADPDEVRETALYATEAGTVVAVDTCYAADRTWRRALPAWQELASGAQILDSVITIGDRPATQFTALISQLAVVRPVVGAFNTARAVHRNDQQYVVSAQAGQLGVTLTGVMSTVDMSSLSVDLVSIAARWSARFDGDALARPAVVTRFDADGSAAAPCRYESPHRAAWLDLHAAITEGTLLPYTLDELAADLELANTLVGAGH
jgi:hypothetical protein